MWIHWYSWCWVKLGATGVSVLQGRRQVPRRQLTYPRPNHKQVAPAKPITLPKPVSYTMDRQLSSVSCNICIDQELDKIVRYYRSTKWWQLVLYKKVTATSLLMCVLWQDYLKTNHFEYFFVCFWENMVKNRQTEPSGELDSFLQNS